MATKTKRKPEANKQVVPVTVRFTRREVAGVRRKAGPISLATFVRLAAIRAGALSAAA